MIVLRWFSEVYRLRRRNGLKVNMHNVCNEMLMIDCRLLESSTWVLGEMAHSIVLLLVVHLLCKEQSKKFLIH